MKKFLFLSLLLFFLFTLVPQPVNAAEEVKVYFFYGDGCPHCAKEEKFLPSLAKDNPALKIYSFEVWQNRTNLELLKKVGLKLEADVSGVPFTVIGNWSISGYLNDQTTGQQIKKQIEKCLEISCPDVVGKIREKDFTPNKGQESKLPEKIYLPYLGEIEIKNFSLPILTIIIGALDGFNPCAMWVLLFLISFLLGMKNRRRMWILGTTFIVASAAVYFVFMAAWLNLLLFLGFIIWIRIIIGLAALLGGGYHLREWWVKREAHCKVTKNERRQKIFIKLKEIAQNKKFILAMVGIILLAFSVNLVELICSAGLPALYTQILTLTPLTKLSYYLYLLWYIFIFMLDDLVVFIMAMITLKATGLTTKYSRYSNLIGGILMLIIGILLIFKPGWLMFG